MEDHAQALVQVRDAFAKIVAHHYRDVSFSATYNLIYNLSKYGHAEALHALVEETFRKLSLCRTADSQLKTAKMLRMLCAYFESVWLYALSKRNKCIYHALDAPTPYRNLLELSQLTRERPVSRRWRLVAAIVPHAAHTARCLAVFDEVRFRPDGCGAVALATKFRHLKRCHVCADEPSDSEE